MESSISIACIALYKNKILIAKRLNTGDMACRWELPGGKVDAGETETDAVKREFLEEFGVKIKVGEYICSTTFEHNNKTRTLKAYRIFVPHRGLIFKYHLTEHSEYKWVCFNEIPREHFVDSDLKILTQVYSYAEKNI